MTRRTDSIKAGVLALLMAAGSVLALVITPSKFLADQHVRETLKSMVPQSFGDWTVDTSIVPIAPPPDLQAVIDATYDETLALTYRNAQGERVMLSLAYGRNQHKGMNTHKPEICYPAQGFKVTVPTFDGVVKAGGTVVPVKRLVTEIGQRTEPITYWLLVGNEITAFGYPMRKVAISYGLKGLVPDGVLVRVSSIGRDQAGAFALHDQFIAQLIAALPPSQRSRLIGGVSG